MSVHDRTRGEVFKRADAASYEALERGLRVIGVDLYLGMLALARDMLGEMGEATVSAALVATDAEDLAVFSEGSVRAALSLYALLHLPRPERALMALYRILTPGGSAGRRGRGWTIADDCRRSDGRRLASRCGILMGRRLEAPALIHQLLARHFDAGWDELETPLARRSRGRPAALKSLVEKAGFEAVRLRWRGWLAEVSTAEEFWTLQTTFSSVARKSLASAPVEAREALRHDFFEPYRRVLSRGGRLVYPHAALAVVARR